MLPKTWGAADPQGAVHAATWRETLRGYDDGAGFLAGQHSNGRMNYAALERAGLLIGTGVIEATAKTLVSVRMKRAGSRFSQHGGQTVLLFRSATASDRFDPLMRELHATYVRNVVEPKKLAA